MLYYVLARPKFGYSGFRVVAVTSLKARQVYGRDASTGAATHFAEHDVLHRFPAATTAEFALAAGERADAVHQAWAPILHQAQEHERTTRETMRAAELRAAKGEPLPAWEEAEAPRPIPAPRILSWRNLWGLLS